MRAVQVVRLGRPSDVIEVREVDTESAARQGQFVGSPTIRVNGVDIQPPAHGEPTGLTCRVYRHRDGRISPLPDSEDVREALVIGEDTPIVACDARVRESAKTTLIELVQHALARASAVLRSPANTPGGVGAGTSNP